MPAPSYRTVEFGEFLPDLPPLANPGALEARNVIAELRSYRPLRSLVTISDALTGPAVGSYWALDASGGVNLFAGDATSLYRLAINSTWTDVSRTGGYTGVTNWEFVKFGERVVAFASGVEPQFFDMGTSTTFADLPGSPPQSARAGVIQDFIVTGDAPNTINRLQWSGFNASELWPPGNIPQQADFQDLFGRGGRIQRIVDGDYGVIFLEHAIWRMDYVGPDLIFTVREIEPNRGTPAPNSVAWTGRQIYYYSQDGFYVTDGTGRSQNIGNNRINMWFESRADPSSIATMRSAVDRRNRLVMWAFKDVAEAALNDTLLIYNWGADRWSYASLTTQLVSEALGLGFTMDSLDALLPGGLDSNPVNLDSPEFAGGSLNFIAFDSQNRMASFSGEALDSTIDTKELSAPGGQRSFINAVRPLVSGAPSSVTVQIGVRNNQETGAPSFGPASGLNVIGAADFRTNGRYHRFRVNITGDYEHAQGCEVALRYKGKR